jgi:hypothetical protein
VNSWVELAADRYKVPGLKRYLPQLGIWWYVIWLILENTPCEEMRTLNSSLCLMSFILLQIFRQVNNEQRFLVY